MLVLRVQYGQFGRMEKTPCTPPLDVACSMTTPTLPANLVAFTFWYQFSGIRGLYFTYYSGAYDSQM